jgi:hypothetical protein
MTGKAPRRRGQRTSRSEDIDGSTNTNSSIERRSHTKIAPPSQLEHESGPITEQTAQLSNGQTQQVADNERPAPDQVGSEAGLEASRNAEFVRNPESFVRQEEIPPEYADGKPETRTAFEAKSQMLMEKMRRMNMSIGEIASLWEMSKSGVWSRVGHIEPKATPQAPVQANSSPLPSRPTDNNEPDGGYDLSGQRQVPRVPSEVVGVDRPSIVEDGQGYDGNEGAIAQTISNRPDADILKLLFARQPEWLDVFLLIRGYATADGYLDPVKFFHERIRKDREDADFFRASIPHDDDHPESLRENFAMIVRKSNAYDEANRKSGLETHKGMGGMGA